MKNISGTMDIYTNTSNIKRIHLEELNNENCIMDCKLHGTKLPDGSVKLDPLTIKVNISAVTTPYEDIHNIKFCIKLVSQYDINSITIIDGDMSEHADDELPIMSKHTTKQATVLYTNAVATLCTQKDITIKPNKYYTAVNPNEYYTMVLMVTDETLCADLGGIEPFEETRICAIRRFNIECDEYQQTSLFDNERKKYNEQI